MAKRGKAEHLDTRRILTPEFRVSYPHVHKPQQYKGKGDAKYSVTMLFKKSQDLSALKLAIKHAKIDQFGPNKDNWPAMDSPVVDGDDPKYADREGYKGHWAIKASSREDSRPGVVDENVEPITNPADFYPGCYARAQVFAYCWGEDDSDQGVSFILDHVQKTRDGKSFGGKKAVNEVFAPIAGKKSKSGDDDEDSEDEDDEDESFR